MTGVSPERAAYEAGTMPPIIPWEHLGPEDKDEWRMIVQAAIKASPELAEARATIDGLRALVAEMIAEFRDGESSPLLDVHWLKALVSPGTLAKWHKRAGLKP